MMNVIGAASLKSVRMISVIVMECVQNIVMQDLKLTINAKSDATTKIVDLIMDNVSIMKQNYKT